MKLRFAPSPFVMSISGIENPSASLFSHPSPRLSVVALYPLHQDSHVFVKMTVYVSFVPRFEFADSRHHRMVRIYDIDCEITYTMGLKLAANRLDKPIGIPEAEGCTMNWDQSFTTLNVC